MKEKVKRFFIEKKELIIFIGVVVLVFAAVITVASIAMNNKTKPVGTPADTQQPYSTPTTTTTDNDTSTTTEIPMVFEMPISGEYVVVRGFFDQSLSDEELQACMIDTGSKVIASLGISYARKDNSVFSISAMYDGEVVSIIDDELEGTTITIKHSNDIYSIYSSLSDVKVSIGDMVSKGNEIGKASASIKDAAAGVHVHVQVKIDGKYVNPATIYGKTADDLVESK